MDKSIITFSANEQNLQKTGGIGCYASDTVSYIEAQFTLGENWSGYDSIRAVWFNDYKTISTVLDFNGVCIVPHEVLVNRGKVTVNLVGSVLVSGELSDRLTTFPCEALKVSAKAKISGSETAAVTPSQFEQFVSIVISEVEKVTGMTAQAETLPAGSQATARYEDGILYLGIPQGIQGERGETGADGADGNGIASVVYNADYSLTLIFDNGEQFTTPPIRGERGPAGADGRDGTDGADGVTPNLSIGNVTTLEPSEDAYVTRRGTDANPIFDFGIPKGDTGTVPDLDLILPTDTASGDIVSITDGQNVVPVKSLKVTLEPIQDLHGYDSSWTAGAGKNVLPFYTNGGNNLGLTVSYDEDEECYIINGTTTADGNVQLANPAKVDWVMGETYTLSVTKVSGSMTIGEGTGITFAIALFNQNYDRWIRGSTTATDIDSRLNATDTAFAVVNGHLLLQCWRTGTVFNNLKIRIQIEKGSTATSWTPYSNICPISGHTEVDTVRTGRNLLDNNGLSDYTTWESLGSSNYAKALNLPKNTQVTISGQHTVPSGVNSYVYLQKFGGTDWQNIRTLWQANVSSMPYTFTTDDSSYRLWAYNPSASIATIDWMQIELGSTATAYEPYEAETYTTTLGRTVYGGTPEQVGGQLTDKMAMVDLGTLNWAYQSSTTRFIVDLPTAKRPPYNQTKANMVCSALEVTTTSATENPSNDYCIGLSRYATLGVRYNAISSVVEFKTAMNGVMLCYELATPQTYQLTPQTISLLHGNNNVWSDGEVELTYNADVGLYIDKKLGASGTRTLSMTKNTKSEETKTDDAETELKSVQLAED